MVVSVLSSRRQTNGNFVPSPSKPPPHHSELPRSLFYVPLRIYTRLFAIQNLNRMENSSTGQTPSHSEIANLAEAIYVESGRIPGRDVENWLAAEAQIKQRQNQPKIQQTQSKAQ